ncbi:MAG: GxxExxY protein [Alphaproteobacteria bacterium]
MNNILTTERTEFTENLNTLSGQIVDSGIYIHRQLGPGLLKSAYQKALTYIFTKRKIPFEKEKSIPVTIDGVVIDDAYRADFVVANQIILETKSVRALQPIDEAQLLTYMKLGRFPLGLLMNFNVRLLKDGIKRMRL